MAAIEGDRVQFLRSYCDLLSAENKNNKKNCERLKRSAGLDPYSVSANFFFRSMDKWPEVKFPDMVKEHFKAYKCLQSYQNFVFDCVRKCNLCCSFGPRSVVNIVAKDSGFTDESLFDMMFSKKTLVEHI
ncbi:hypothetical protein pdam_00024290 [Pocillopora damicornis]|uniref:Uncharacterized protein n=1 Tax=Pocillopora damicornis TaxID=46731 RepID=A0A3M6TBI5_POCDA|nr:hypothetical protein pdam_00024290 [Pocillopora damicornis]